jgi:GntR family transcriptional regulator
MADKLTDHRVDGRALVRRDAAPRYSLVEEHVREQIATGSLTAGDRLPNETDMGVQYGVARSVIRQALDNLERDGLVVRMRAKGTFIAEPDLSLPADSLSSFAQELELHGIQASSRVLAFETRPADARLAASLAIPEGVMVPYIERLRLGDGDVLGWDATWVHPDLADSLREMDLERDVLFDFYRDAGRVVQSVDRRVRAVVATRDLAAKMDVSEGAPLLEIGRVVRDVAGAVLDRQLRLYRGDRFSLAMDASGRETHADPAMSPRLRFDG